MPHDWPASGLVKVLHLPYNIGSQIDTMVCALRHIGVDARGLVLNNAASQSCGESIETRRSYPWRRRPIRRMLQNVSWWRAVMRALRWADVVHWRYGARSSAALPWDLDLRYLARADKPRLIDFCGTDIRITEVMAADNPYFAAAYQRGEMPPSDRTDSIARQALFSRYGFTCILRRFEMTTYLQEEYFPSYYMIPGPIMLSEFAPKYPDPTNARPLIVHCPSRKGAKGTRAVLAAIERLRGRYAFEFKLVHGMGRQQALALTRDADIVLDQFVWGEYGNVSLEAMAFGKPTVCYLKPALAARYPPDLPIVNANQDNLAAVLVNLIEDGDRRYAVGRRSRHYLEKHHDAPKVARQLKGIYEELLAEKAAQAERESQRR